MHVNESIHTHYDGINKGANGMDLAKKFETIFYDLLEFPSQEIQIRWLGQSNDDAYVKSKVAEPCTDIFHLPPIHVKSRVWNELHQINIWWNNISERSVILSICFKCVNKQYS